MTKKDYELIAKIEKNLKWDTRPLQPVIRRAYEIQKDGTLECLE